MKFEIFTYSDIGGRNNNEDSLLACEDGERTLLAVADGLGGYECGEIASSLTVAELKRCFDAKKKFNISDAVKSANEIVIENQSLRKNKMKTTISAAFIDDENVIFANVGDTHAYGFKNGKIVFQSKDHSAVQVSVDLGQINVDDIRHLPGRNQLTRTIGSENATADVNEFRCQEIDAILICSDGFWEYVFESEMEECLRLSSDPETWLYKMEKIHRTRIRDGNDNSTAVAAMLL